MLHNIKIPKKTEIGTETSNIAGRLKNKTGINKLGYKSPLAAFSKNWIDSLKNRIPKRIKKVKKIVLVTCFKIYKTIIFGIISFLMILTHKNSI